MGGLFSAEKKPVDKKPTRRKFLKTYLRAYKNSYAARSRDARATLGVVRLDHDYPVEVGDIDHPESFQYGVFYRAVPGLTFEICKSGKLSNELKKKFIDAIKFLDQTKKVSAITSDCGFFMWFQDLARKHTEKPVLMSSLVQLPSITAAYAKHEKIAIFTADSNSLNPMYSLISDQCGVDVRDERYVIVGCQNVPGFGEAVRKGTPVNEKKATPDIIKLAKATMREHPDIRAFLFECTQLPIFSDAVRHAVSVPVYDAITCSNMFIEGLLDNPHFGLNEWQDAFDGVQEDYKLGDNLSDDEKRTLVSLRESAKERLKEKSNE